MVDIAVVVYSNFLTIVPAMMVGAGTILLVPKMVPAVD